MEGMIKKYAEWIMRQESADYLLRKDESGNIHLLTDYAFGVVRFYDLEKYQIVELSVTNSKTDENSFYLHFELKDLDRAKTLFLEMTESLRRLKDKKRTKVLLCCSSAITTSFFMIRLNEAAKVLSLDMDFMAVSYNDLFVKGFECDVILLAPQISYVYEKTSEILKDKIVLTIPPSIFGEYDVQRLIDLVRLGMINKENERKEEMYPAERMEFPNLPKLLIISIIVEYTEIRIIYRIYDKGEMISSEEILKDHYELIDLEDVIDVAIARNPDIEIVCVVTPGVINNGRMTFRSAGIYDIDVVKLFDEKYHREFIIVNDANMMALGYYGLQKKSKNVSFYFHPHAARTAGVGNVVDGKLHAGSHQIAGEMQYLHSLIQYTDDPSKLAGTIEGSLEIIAKYMISIIACVDPDIIVIYCDMLTDITELSDAISIYVQPRFIPELIKVPDVIEYMFVGGLMQCADQWKKTGK